MDKIALAQKIRTWAERAKSVQIALDLSKDPEDIAIRAGQLQDLSEEMFRVAELIKNSPAW